MFKKHDMVISKETPELYGEVSSVVGEMVYIKWEPRHREGRYLAAAYDYQVRLMTPLEALAAAGVE